jgi:hypothetical protein
LFAVSRSELEDLEEPEEVRQRALLLLYLEQHVTVEHSDARIIVTMPGTSFSVIYVRAGDNKLVASGFSSATANAKARELGWIA